MLNAEFLSGMKACLDGDPCPPNADPDFEEGYWETYRLEQETTYKTEIKDE